MSTENRGDARSRAIELLDNGKLEDAFDAYMKLAKDGDVESQEFLAWMYYEGKGVEKDESKAIEWFSTATSNGSKSGLYRLGLIYRRRKEYAIAIGYLNQAAAAGFAPALARLGQMMEHGIGQQRDIARAADAYEKAWRLGNLQAKRKLGLLWLRTGRKILNGALMASGATLQIVWRAVRDPYDESLLS